jgi:hypothetical protein
MLIIVCLLEHTGDRKFHRQHRPAYLLHPTHLITGLDNHEHIVYGDEVATPDDQSIVFIKLTLLAGHAGYRSGE